MAEAADPDNDCGPTGFCRHSYGRPSLRYQTALALGLDWAMMSHHTEGDHDGFLQGRTETYVEQCSNHSIPICDEGGFQLHDGSCTQDTWAFMDDETTHAELFFPGRLALLGGEYTVGPGAGAAPSGLDQMGGHKVFVCKDRPTTMCPPSPGQFSDAVCQNETELYDMMRANDCFGWAAHPCSELGTWFGSSGQPFDSSVLSGYAVKAPNSDQCVTDKGPHATNMSYFDALNAGHHLHPVSDKDTHWRSGAGAGCGGIVGDLGTSERTICWMPDLDYDELAAAFRERRCYWARDEKPRLEFRMCENRTFQNCRMLGGMLDLPGGDDVVVVARVVDLREASDYRIKVFHNGVPVGPDTFGPGSGCGVGGDMDPAGGFACGCDDDECMMLLEFKDQPIDGWWLVIVEDPNRGPHGFAVISSPVWVNRAAHLAATGGVEMLTQEQRDVMSCTLQPIEIPLFPGESLDAARRVLERVLSP
jgi:hypothetical protein